MKVIVKTLICFLLLSACSIEDDSMRISYQYVGVSDIVVPDSFVLGQSYDLEATLELPSDCFIFSGFEMDIFDNQRYVRAVLTQIEANGTCENTEPQMITEQLTFQALQREDYIFKFLTGYDDLGNEIYLEYTIPVTL